jgi:acyl-CoA synthetase (AMP-forming)/AMP-acid ligase II
MSGLAKMRDRLAAARVLQRRGMVDVSRPDEAVRAFLAIRRYGAFGGLAGHTAARYGDSPVVGVDDAEFGKRLAAFVVSRDELDVDDVKSFVRAHLARHKIPRDVVFVTQLPRNETGKVLRRQLADSS